MPINKLHKDRKIHVGIIAPVAMMIPPKKRGGTEWIVHYHVEGFVKKGYDVTLFAQARSKTSARLIPIANKETGSYNFDYRFCEQIRKFRLELSLLATTMMTLRDEIKKLDIVFNHSIDGGIAPLFFQSFKVPIITTLHLPLFPELIDVYQTINAPLISISNNQRKVAPKLNYVKTIYNGIDLKQFPFGNKPSDYFLFVGKIGPHKNPHEAILAAKKAGVKLILVGSINDQQYFNKEIKPHLNKRIIWMGELEKEKLITLYQKARGFIFPIKWEEPFGLVMIEAMACGTPVIAYPHGSIPEIIHHGFNGFIVKNVNQMSQAIKNIKRISRQDCREIVEKKFSRERLVNDYESVITKML